MSTRTRASSPGGVAQYRYIIYAGINLSSAIFNNLAGGVTNQNSVADRYFASPIIVPTRLRIDKIGHFCGAQANTGNVRFGVHDSDSSNLPNSRVCQTGNIAVNTLSSSLWSWHVPTTTPTIVAGLYYVGYICDTIYSAGVSGLRTVVSPQVEGGGSVGEWLDGLSGVYREDVGSLNVPNPMTEVVDTEERIIGLALEVTVL